MTRLALAFLAAAALPALAEAAPLPIETGYWESTNRIVSPIKQTKTERRCLTPADVTRFVEGQLNRHYRCEYPTNIISGGKIRLKGVCMSKHGRKVPVDGWGSYTPTSFDLTADAVVELLGLDVKVRMSTEARKIADDCPPPETEDQP